MFYIAIDCAVLKAFFLFKIIVQFYLKHYSECLNLALG